KVGDHLVFDRTSSWVVSLAQEKVGLTLNRQGISWHVTVDPAPVRLRPGGLFELVAWWAIGVVPLGLGLLIGYQQSRNAASRCLAFAFLCLGLNLICNLFELLPVWAAPSTSLCEFLVPPLWYYSTAFAVLFPDSRPEGVRAALKHYALPLLALLCVAM